MNLCLLCCQTPICLNQIVPSSVIAKANKIVAAILPSVANYGHSVERDLYTKFTFSQQYEIGKRAAEYGVALSINAVTSHAKGVASHTVHLTLLPVAVQPSKYYHTNVSSSFICQKLTFPKYYINCFDCLKICCFEFSCKTFYWICFTIHNI